MDSDINVDTAHVQSDYSSKQYYPGVPTYSTYLRPYYTKCYSSPFPRKTLYKSFETQRRSETSIFSSIPRNFKRYKSISRGHYENSRLCHVYELDMYDSSIRNIPRAGLIPYTFIDGKLYLCFGKDKKSGDLTDFGGGKKRSESPIECAVREGNEESRYAFSNIQKNQVSGYLCLYSSNMLIIFVPVASPNKIDVRDITNQNFLNKRFLSDQEIDSYCYNEVSELMWLDENDISILFSNRPQVQLFAKVRRFICSCNYFSKNVTKMKEILYSVIFGSTEKLTNSNFPAITVDKV